MGRPAPNGMVRLAPTTSRCRVHRCASVTICDNAGFLACACSTSTWLKCWTRSNGALPPRKATVADLVRRLARLRVPLGFLFAIGVLWLAQPTRPTLLAGSVVGGLGEALRI